MVWWSAIVEQKLLKWWTQHATKMEEILFSMLNWMAQIFTNQLLQFQQRVWAVICFFHSPKNTSKSWWLEQKKFFFLDVILIFDCKFDASWGNPILKKKSLVKLIDMKKTLYSCDIWRIRNPNVRRFTYRQNHVYGFTERRLHFFLISNILQESIIKTDVLRFVPIFRRYFFLCK